jgi:hypothetical protein
MKLTCPLKTVLASLAAACVLTLTAHGQMINVLNASFEDPTLGAGQFTGYTPFGGVSNDMPDWTPVTSGGVQITGIQNATGTYTSGVDGSNFAYTNSSTPFYQVLSTDVGAGVYTLQVDLGERTGTTVVGGVFGLYTASGGNLGPALTLGTETVLGATLTPGAFTNETLTVVVAPGDPNIGQSLAIGLSGVNDISNDNADFDNVRLNFTPIPEPSTYALMLGALLPLGLLYRRGMVRATAA